MNKKEWREVEISFEEGTIIGDIELISAKGSGIEIGKFLRGIKLIQGEIGHESYT